MLADNFLYLHTPAEIRQGLAARAKAARLDQDLSQQSLAEKAGVSLGSLKRFERTGLGSISLLVQVAFALRHEREFETLFQPPKFKTIEDVLDSDKKRQRGRR